MSFILRMQLFALDGLISNPYGKSPNALLVCTIGDHHEIPLQMIIVLLKIMIGTYIF